MSLARSGWAAVDEGPFGDVIVSGEGLDRLVGPQVVEQRVDLTVHRASGL